MAAMTTSVSAMMNRNRRIPRNGFLTLLRSASVGDTDAVLNDFLERDMGRTKTVSPRLWLQVGKVGQCWHWYLAVVA